MNTWKRMIACAIRSVTSGSHGQATIVCAALIAMPTLSSASSAALVPSSVFIQAAEGDEQTSAYSLGVTWDWRWRASTRLGTLTGYFEASLGRWVTDSHDVAGSAWVTQLGLTPVLRLHPAGPNSRWFAEAGIGANYIAPLYQSGSKRFSTTFNFGDHLGVGFELGTSRRYELALRLQHFSNAGIDHPNPGENFAEIRISRLFNATK
jgi:opacity protein-like surface antigen